MLQKMCRTQHRKQCWLPLDDLLKIIFFISVCPLLNVEHSSYCVLMQVFIFDKGNFFSDFKSSLREIFANYLCLATLTNVITCGSEHVTMFPT